MILVLVRWVSWEQTFASRYRTVVHQAALDQKLQKVTDRMSPYVPSAFADMGLTLQWKLGQALFFFSPVLSGDRDVSCATCHILQNGLSRRTASVHWH